MSSIKPYISKGKKLYRVQVYIGIDPLSGKKRYRSRQGLKSERAARAAAAELTYLAEHEKDTVQPKLVTFRQMSDEYWQSYVPTIRETTATVVASLLKLHILPEIGEYRLAAMTMATMQQAVNQWENDIPSSVSRCINYVNAVYKQAMRLGIISKNPTQFVVKPRQKTVRRNDEFLFWNRDQIAKFFNCLNTNKDMEKVIAFKLLFFGGLRRGELLALTWHDLCFDSEVQLTVTIDKTLVAGGKVNPPKTQASYRSVPIIDAELVELLHRWKNRQAEKLATLGHPILADEKQLLFTTRRNTTRPLVDVSHWLAAIIRKNDLKPYINLHKTRHSFISNLLLAGVEIPVVQKLAGHASPTVTLQIYAHINQQSKVDAAETLAKYFETNKEK
ncbi:tyrosine-type recombinase/integrase [Schleiferilactobacillus harbinensis]|uniref:tyrosine-type recombinase/integrase n=1 Tax=Schleiferilactobacillus harbinensis TaxID=304207 RepID=UPI0039E9969D